MDKQSFPPQAHELLQWSRDLQTASRMFGKPIECPTNMEIIMEHSGLTDITHRTVRVPLRYREDDQREKAISGGFKLCVSHLREKRDKNRTPMFFDSMSMALFTRQLQMHPQTVADLCARLRAIVNSDLPIYFNLCVEPPRNPPRLAYLQRRRHVWTARRPGS